MTQTDVDSGEKSTITSDQLDPNFKYEVAKELGGKAVKFCYQCGTCAAGCPIRAIHAEFNPRTIVRMVLLGMRDELLKSEEIWHCSNCYTCYERCPQDVRPTDIIMALRQIATREGLAHSSFRQQVDLLGDMGRLYEITELEEGKRERLHLPQLRAKTDDIGKIIEKTELKKKIKGEKGGK
ncbi:MAG: 4Fe-4S dicluster domain-containing protein [Promethearchaeota archaeon]